MTIMPGILEARVFNSFSRAAAFSGGMLALILLTLKAMLPFNPKFEMEVMISSHDIPCSKIPISSQRKCDRASLLKAFEAGSRGAENL
ncbi:MAG: hypothetical protein ACUVQY_05845 [Thermoproteota archaeon]